MKINKKRLIVLIVAVLILICLISLIIFSIIKLLNKSGTEGKFVPQPVALNFESRIDKLNSFNDANYYKFGWLQVEGTGIDVPIIDSSSAGNVDTIDYSFAWMSSAYATSENRPVILGHNIINVSSEPLLPSKDLTNFEALMAFAYYNFAKDNLYIQYTHDGKDEIYLIYAIGFYDYGYDNAESFSNKEFVKSYIERVRKNSIYNYDLDVNEDDEIITVKTCTRYFGKDKKQQLFVDARKLRENEKTMKYQVKKSKNFEKLELKEEKS